MNYIDIIGMGMSPRDLTMFHMELIQNCDLLVAGARHLSFFPDHKGKTLKITKDISSLIKQLKDLAGSSRIVVLASGDPMFYGIGSTLSASINKKWLRIHPNISSVAAAFSKIGLPWHDAQVFSLHSKEIHPSDFPSLKKINKAAFLTAPGRGPAYIAAYLKKARDCRFNICVLEHLGDPDREKVSWFNDPEKLMGSHFSDPNVVILIRQTQPSNSVTGHACSEESALDTSSVSHETHIGMADSYFSHSSGLITKTEIRVLSLSKLKLTRQDHRLWDIGSGSGSVGIEAALLVPKGQVVAIEKNKSRLAQIEANLNRFHLENVTIQHLNFPEGIEDLPVPDRIFVGGGGNGLEQVISRGTEILRPGGIMVVNTVIIENMTIAMETMAAHRMSPEMIQVQVSRSAEIAGGHRLTPLNPVWIISGSKPL